MYKNATRERERTVDERTVSEREWML